MGRIRPTDIDLVKKLTAFGKSYFTLSDLEKIVGLKKNSLSVTLHRLVKSGVLLHLGKNIYSLFTQTIDYEKIANELYFPSYVSFETALSYYSILSQIPYTKTLATERPSKKTVINGIAVVYSHVPKNLFFGYVLENSIYIAEPEKALLDQFYMVSRGKRTIAISELDLKNIDTAKLDAYAKKFPSYLAPRIKDVKKYIGTTPVTLEDRQRITW